MSYKYLIVIVALIQLISCKERNRSSQKEIQLNNEASKIKYNTLENDTFYLYKMDSPDWAPSYYGYIYKSDEEKLYQNLYPKIGFNNFSLDNNPYPNSSRKRDYRKIDLLDIPTRWTEVIYYGKEFYLNYPSDFCRLKQQIITDSCLISKTCEGPLPSMINKVSKLRNNQYVLEQSYDSPETNTTRITIIDAARGVAVWQNSETDFQLYAYSEKFKTLPIAKAKCNGKCAYEIRTEELDFTGLIRDATK